MVEISSEHNLIWMGEIIERNLLSNDDQSLRETPLVANCERGSGCDAILILKSLFYIIFLISLILHDKKMADFERRQFEIGLEFVR